MVLDIYAYAQLFGGDSPYEDDDREADKIYQAIDDRMDSRRKRRYGPCDTPLGTSPIASPGRLGGHPGGTQPRLTPLLSCDFRPFSAILGAGARSNSWRP